MANIDWTAVLMLLALGIIFAAIGVGLLFFARSQDAKAKVTERWPTVQGSVIASRVESHTVREHDQGHTYTRTHYTPVVDYAYEVGGRALRSGKIYPGADLNFDLGTAQGIVNRYQAGQPATVHYDPADPTQAVLETQSKGANVLLIVGAVFGLIGLLACFGAGAMAFAG